MNDERLARRARHLTTDLPQGHFAWQLDPDVVAFDSGFAAAELLPDLTAIAAEALTAHRSETLQYSRTQGQPALRAWIAEYMGRDGAAVGPDELLIVNGAKQGLDLICRLLVDEGDAIVVTAPMYFTAIPIFRSFGVEFIEIGQDAHGLDVDALERVLAVRAAEGLAAPKFIYNVPEFHNPTGLTMSRRRREALLDIARRYGTWVVEDSPYRAIRFEGTADPTLLALDQSANVIHVGTFSKLLAPGIRVGWVVAPPEIIGTVVRGDAEIGFDQMSNVAIDPRVEPIRVLPNGIQHYTNYVGGIVAESMQEESARALIIFLRSSSSQAAMKQKGFEPL